MFYQSIQNTIKKLVMNEKEIITIVSKVLKKKVNKKSSVRNTEEWDSLGQLGILLAMEKATKGKSSKIDLTEVQSIEQLCIKLKKIK
jgi:acyl carrier protein